MTDPDITDAPPEVPAVLELVRVTKRFGDVTAVRDASFAVRRGEFFSLLGPSGCGKTTTLRTMAGFEQPSLGRILIEGRDASTIPPHRRNTNLVFQNYALFPHMTVAENVAFGPERQRRRAGLAKGEVEERVRGALTTVQMHAFAARYPRELSGGQQQRVAVARALANRPAVLLLDEPLGSLDLKLREEMQFELKRIQREVGVSFVYVTHDQGEALTMSDRIAVMNHGTIQQIGTPEEIYLRPATSFVAGFIGGANLIACELDRLGPQGVSVILGGARLPAEAAATACEPGRPAVLVLRPEHLTVSREEPVAATRLPIRIEAVTFQGPVVRYQIRAEQPGVEEGPYTASAPTARRLDVQAGEHGWISWDPADAYVALDERDVGAHQPTQMRATFPSVGRTAESFLMQDERTDATP